MSMEVFVSNSGRAPGAFPWRVAASRWGEVASPLAVAALRKRAPVGKGPSAGRLRDTIGARAAFAGSGLQVRLGSTVPQALFVRDGTRPHVIVPVRARALHFTGKGGAQVFTRRVNHPGTKPNPFAKDALREITPALHKLFSDVMREALGGPL